jgi:peptide/nickel transport system ATP-binding protein
LIGSVPSRNARGRPLTQIPGVMPSMLNLPSGCAFRLRCAHADAACAAEPPPPVGSARQVRCFHPLAEVA